MNKSIIEKYSSGSSQKQVVVNVSSFKEFMNNLEYPIAIDSYQRPYVWTEDKVEELVDDLQEYLKDMKGLSYYMGSILLHEGIDSKDDEQKLFVIDGQQRITTLTVLYYILYGELPNVSKMGLSYNSPISVKQIHSAKEIFQKHISLLSAYKEQIFNNIHFTFIKTYSEDLAFTFFDTQNNRGVKLAATDLLKAYHLRAINNSHKELQIGCAQKWEKIQTSETAFKNRDDFVEELFEKFIWRSRTWKGQNSLDRESDDAILESFQKPTLVTDNNSIPLYANINNQLANEIQVDGQNNYKLTTNAVRLTNDSSYLPFTLRQPIGKGLGFFLFTEKYASLMQKLLKDEVLFDDIEIKAFRAFYKDVFEYVSIYLKELFLLAVLVYYDKYGSRKLLEFSLWLDHHLGAIRLKKHYIFWQAPIKFLKENPQNILDVISTSFMPEEPIDYMKKLAKPITVYEVEKFVTNKGVQGRYKEHLLRYYNKPIVADLEVNGLAGKKDWITPDLIREKLVCQK